MLSAKRDEQGAGFRMNDKVQASCWGLTTKAVIGIACVLVLAWLLGSPETTAVLAAG